MSAGLQDAGGGGVETPALVGHPHAHARQRPAHPAAPSGGARRNRGDDGGLGGAVALDDLHAGDLPEPVRGVRRQRRRAGDGQAERALCRLGQARLLQQPRVVRRHPHHHAAARQLPQHRFRLEPGEKADGAAGREQDVDGGQQPMGVIGRQRVHQHVLAAQAPHLHQRPGAGGQVAVGDQRALGPSGGAGGVEESGRRVVRQLCRGRALPGCARQLGKGALVAAESLHPKTMLGGRGLERCRVTGITDEQAGARVRQQRLHLARRVGGVHGVQDGSGPETGMGEEHGLDAFPDPHRDPVAWLDAAGHEGAGGPVDGREHVAGGERRPAGDDERRVAGVTVAVQGTDEVAGQHPRNSGLRFSRNADRPSA